MIVTGELHSLAKFAAMRRGLRRRGMGDPETGKGRLTMISSAHEQYASAPNISRWRDRHAQREFWLRDE
jgi:hypothetical protein